MPNGRRRIYWDADVWLSYINGMPDRLPVLDALLAESASPNGSIEIVTSVISQVEVAYAETERLKRALDPEVESRIDKLWADRQALRLVEYHEGIGREARQIIRTAVTKGWSLRSADSIHLASARWMQVSEFHTYELRLIKYSNDIGFPIVAPYTQQPRLGV